MKRILRLIGFVLALFVMVGVTHKMNLWSWSDLLLPDWLQAGPDAVSYVDRAELAIQAIQADAELSGGTMQVADTLTTYIQRDLAADYNASFAFISEIDLCIPTQDAQVELIDSVLVFSFPSSQLCKPRITKAEMIYHDALRHLFIPEGTIEEYRQEESKRALHRLVTMLPQYDLDHLARISEPEVAQLLTGLLGKVWAAQDLQPVKVAARITPPQAQ